METQKQENRLASQENPSYKGNNSEENKNTTGNLPEKKFSAGPISVSIWDNIGKRKNGEQAHFKTLSLQRVYKDKQGQWQNTASLRASDIPRAVLALNKAYEYVSLKEAY